MNLANIITGVRIVCGIMILMLPIFSVWFYVLYLLGGLSDVIDGAVARSRGEESDFGARLDTAADIIFAATVMIKIVAAVSFPVWILIWTGIIILVKIINIMVGAVRCHRLLAIHSVMNKIAGGAAFLVPVTLGTGTLWQVKISVITAALIFTTIAAILECITAFINHP